MQPAYVIGSVDISWSPNVVARNQGRRHSPHALVGDVYPGRPGDEDGVAPLVPVGSRDDLAKTVAPGCQHALDGLGSEIGPVREHDDRRLRLRTQSGQAAAKRRPGAALPVGAVDDARSRRVEGVRADHDDDFVHWALPEPLEHPGKQETLLGTAEAGRRPRREDDGRDQPTAASARSISARAI